jgi:hypothetical protein
MPKRHLLVQRRFFLIPWPSGVAVLKQQARAVNTGCLDWISSCFFSLLPDWIAAALGSYAKESNSSNLNSQTTADEAQPETELAKTSTAGAPQGPARNWVCAAMDCVFALGRVDTAYPGLRPWTRLSVASMQECSAVK